MNERTLLSNAMNQIDAHIYTHKWGLFVLLQMNRLSLRNNRLKFETSGEILVSLEKSVEYTSNE